MLAVTPEIKRADLAVADRAVAADVAVAETASLAPNAGLAPLVGAAFGADIINAMNSATPTAEASAAGAKRIAELASSLG